MDLHVSSLAIYPVKGLRGIDLPSAVVERQGMEHDRRWAVLRPDGVVLTQRDLPDMARIDAVPEGNGLRLECAGHGGVSAVAGTEAVTAIIWRNPVATVSAGDEASAWLGRVLGTPCRLVHLADPAARPVTPNLARPGDTVSLADGFPLLVTTTGSLAALNGHLESAVPMARFRPNLVVEGAGAWAEDGWPHITVGGVRLRLASPCARCKVVTLDQRSGETPVRMEPLRTLGRIRRDEAGHINFGWNAVPETLGVVRVGDAVVA